MQQRKVRQDGGGVTSHSSSISAVIIGLDPLRLSALTSTREWVDSLLTDRGLHTWLPS